MMSLKSMKKRYCISYELETKGCVSTYFKFRTKGFVSECSKFIMYLGESIDVNDKNLQKSISAMVHSFILKILPQMLFLT